MHKFYNDLVSQLLFCSFFFLATTQLIAQGGGDRRPCQEDGVISVAYTGETELNTCTDDEIMDRIRFQIRPFRQAFAFFVVDENDIILSIGFSSYVNFDLLPSGTLRVFAFSNYGRITATVGDNYTTTELSASCAGLTTNFVTVNNSSSGDVIIESAQDSYTVCIDEEPDVLTFSSPFNNVNYIVTDTLGVIHAVTPSGDIDFNNAGVDGTCYVYAFASLDPIPVGPGDNISALADIVGCGVGLSNNFITVERLITDGGAIATVDGATTLTTCPNDGNADEVTFSTTNVAGENSRLIVTDDNNEIIGLPPGDVVDFEGAGQGVCRVYNLAYTGDFIGQMGDNIDNTELTTGCEDLSDNYVEVTREIPVGGELLTSTGESEVTTCPGDGNDDLVDVINTGADGGQVVYLVTDANNMLLDFNETGSFNFEDAGAGNCRVWSVTYQGELTLDEGIDVTTATLADNCFELSANFINVIRQIPAGGTLATDTGETAIRTCPGDGMADVINFVSTDADQDASFTYIISDPFNTVLAIVEGDSFDFEGAEAGVCRVWGLSYAGDLLVAEGDNLIFTMLSSACYALSDNFITVTREQPLGGAVALDDGTTEAATCPGDGLPDVLTFVSTGAEGENFAFVITDDNGFILGFPASASVDFDEVEPGTCRVYGLSYYGEIDAIIGSDINGGDLATGCFALSDNFITVIREPATTGPISTEDGETEILACPGDAFPDVFRFDSTGTSLTNFNYLVTDENNVVFFVAFTDRIDFEQLPVGVCRVWGLGYDGIVAASPGDIAGEDPLATRCYALSENFVTVTKQLPEGGTVATTDGTDAVTVCSMDGVPDLVEVVSTGASGAGFTFLVTTADNIILEVGDGPSFDFDAAPFGVCRIWGLAYQGELLAMAGDTASSAMLASSCFDLSANFITVTREDVLGGTISLGNGATEITTCPGDGIADLLSFTNVGATGNDFQYIVTTEDNVILALVDGTSFDFDTTGVGICRVWGFAYAGSVTAMVGDTAATAMLAEGCFALSDNFITVTREVPEGGSISLADGTLVADVCSGVEEEPALQFTTTSVTGSYTYLIVQDSFALTAIPTDSFNFNRAQGDTYQIYGLGYAGNLTIIPGQNIFTTDLATSCFELSDTFITVNVTEVDGGMILGNGAEEVYFCPENLDDGMVTFTTTSSEVQGNYVYVVTTATQVILGVVDGDEFDFGNLPLMELRVYGICYSGNLLAGPGFSLISSPLATGCVDISDNFITVLNDTPEAGAISFDNVPANGVSCSVDGDGTISVSTTSTSQTGYGVIVTDTSNIIQLVSADPTSVDLGSLPAGAYRVWGLAYTGSITAMVGDDITGVALADNCFELTTDFLEVTQAGSITAGQILNLTTVGTGDSIIWCIPEGDNPIAVVDATVSGPNYRYIVTNPDGRVRATNLPSNIIPFQAFGPGEYRIYGFNYTGMSLVGINQNINTTLLSTECGALTSNFITVIYKAPDGGMVTTAADETEVEIEITGSGEDATAIIAFMTTSTAPHDFVYVITDEENRLLAVSPEPNIDFGPSGVGVCRVWGLSYTGEIIAGLNDDALTTELTDDCFSLSDNFVTVTRVDEVGLEEPGQIDTDEIAAAFQMTARPNPASGSFLYLDIESLTGGLPGGQVYVRDMNGVAYSVQTIPEGGNRTTLRLDISMLPAGMYFAQMMTPAGPQSVRFMKR